MRSSLVMVDGGQGYPSDLSLHASFWSKKGLPILYCDLVARPRLYTNCSQTTHEKAVPHPGLGVRGFELTAWYVGTVDVRRLCVLRQLEARQMRDANRNRHPMRTKKFRAASSKKQFRTAFVGWCCGTDPFHGGAVRGAPECSCGTTPFRIHGSSSSLLRLKGQGVPRLSKTARGTDPFRKPHKPIT